MLARNSRCAASLEDQGVDHERFAFDSRHVHVTRLLSCVEQRDQRYVHIGPNVLPTESYERPPAVAFERSDYAFKFGQMTSFYDVPGEAGYFMNGEDYGFDSLSFILTETHPNGGPPLHTHETEEAHVVLRGSMEYIIGDRRFSVTGPTSLAYLPASRTPFSIPEKSR